jgi:hypothetical protein
VQNVRFADVLRATTKVARDNQAAADQGFADEAYANIVTKLHEHASNGYDSMRVQIIYKGFAAGAKNRLYDVKVLVAHKLRLDGLVVRDGVSDDNRYLDVSWPPLNT